MTRQRSFFRKIIYLAAIALLLPMLFWLGHPATSDTDTAQGSPGGRLAQWRTAERLDQSQLGKIDPTGETIKLATLGMRGIAANLLWTKAVGYQMKKDWTNLSATLNQIVRLQPNFFSVWKFQGWNLAFNCSAEFDGYRDRYRWVIKGVDFLKEGITYNEFDPRLPREVGWTVTQKIGRSDEREQFRRLFVADDDFHQSTPKSQRDCWLVGKKWYLDAERVAETQELVTRLGTSMMLFYWDVPRCQMSYADAIEKDGVFGEKAKFEWKRAAREWADYGRREFPGFRVETIRLDSVAEISARIDELVAQIEALVPDAREKLIETKTAMLTDAHREALAVPSRKRTREEQDTAAEAAALLAVSIDEIARQASPASRAKVNELLDQVKEEQEQLRAVNSSRKIVNYGYWELRAKVEQTDEMVDAREWVYRGDQALAEGNLPEAVDAYDRGVLGWARLLQRYPEMMSDSTTIDDLKHVLDQYGNLCDQRNERFPANFPLAGFVRGLVESNSKFLPLNEGLVKGDAAVAEGDLSAARRNYEDAFFRWDLLTAEIPSLDQMSDPLTGGEVVEAIRSYARVLRELEVPMPDDFILRRFIWIQFENDPKTHAARAAVYQGKRLMGRGELDAARKAMDVAMVQWRALLDEYPSIIVDNGICEEIIKSIDDYRKLLEEQQETLPEDFILRDVLERHEG